MNVSAPHPSRPARPAHTAAPLAGVQTRADIPRWPLAAGCRWPLLLLVALLLGCDSDDLERGRVPGRTVVQPQRNHLDVALDYIGRLEHFDQQQGMVQTAYHLNRWLQSAEDSASWQPTPRLADLPDYLRQIPPLQDLAKREITTEDVYHLREASWLRSISQWASEETDSLQNKGWLLQLQKERGEQHAHELAVALQLFDWTIRNIQLEPLPPDPAAASDGSAAAGDAAADAAGTSGAERMRRALTRAEAGPGYRTRPWQTLLFGRGDAWQRAQVFAGLCRQQEIDVVMLAVAAADERPEPWLPAALIDDQLYLFDTQLGLPLPGPGGQGVATLAEVRAEPDLLRQLDLGQDYRYPVTAEDLDDIVALVAAAPEALSLRMKLIEQQPTSGQRLVLAVDVEQLASRLERAGVRRVQLWQVPLQTWIYRAALPARAQEDPEVLRYLYFEELIFTGGDTPLVQARQQHFRGNFEGDEQEHAEGAKALYLRSRLPNSDLARLSSSPELQQSIGVVRGRESDQQWAAHLERMEAILTRTKQHASYWLGIIHYETSSYSDADDWLQQRCLEAYENGPWTWGARYNLARSYEQQGRLEDARQLLLLDDSPQKHGNLLRARNLRQQMEQASR